MDVMLDQFKRRPTEPKSQFTTGINFEQNKVSIIFNENYEKVLYDGNIDIKINRFKIGMNL